VQRYLQALLRGLQDLGWTPDVNLRVDPRYGNYDGEQILKIAKDLVLSQPELIEVMNTPGVAAVLKETRTIPVVFTVVSDPIGAGFVESFAHPGRNATGFVNIESTMGGKWVQILKEIVPRLTEITLLFNPTTGPQASYYRGAIEEAAQKLSLTVRTAPAEDTATVESEIVAAASYSNAGLIVLPDVFTFGQRELIVSLANRARLPAVYPFPEFGPIGGLVCYGVDNEDLQRRAANYIDRILKGTKPAELPVQLPTKFDLVINIKAAKALDLVVPATLLSAADDVIE
jgi:putative ABC transport system substrate-binding protein